MQRAGAIVLVGALIASGVVAVAVAAWWPARDAVDDARGPPPVVAPARAERPSTRRRSRVRPESAAAGRAGGDAARVPTVGDWVVAEFGGGESLRTEDGSTPSWWDFPLEDVMAALLAVLERDDEMEWSGVRALETMREMGYLAAPWASDVARYLGDPVLAEDAVLTLAAMGPVALPVVRLAVNDDDPRLRERGLRVLSEATYGRREIVELAIAALRDPDADVRAMAIEVLGAHDEAPELAVPALTARVPLPGDDAPLDAVFALAKYGPRAAEAVPGLVRLIADRRERGADAVVAALRAIGPAAEPAVPTLLDLLARDRASYADAVPAAVVAISPEAFRGALSDSRESVRAEFAGRAGTMLWTRDEREEGLVTSLEALARDPSPAVRRAAARSLAEIAAARERDQGFVAWLRKRLAASADLDVGGRVAALDSAAGEAQAARALAGELREFLHDPHDRVRLHAALAVWVVDPPAVDVEPILRSYRDDEALRAELYAGLRPRPPVAWTEHVAWLLHDEPDDSMVLDGAYSLLEGLGADALGPLVRVAAAETRGDRVYWIADLLRGIGSPAAPALRDLAERPGIPAPLRPYLLRLAEEAR